jgi:hypothetical protein
MARLIEAITLYLHIGYYIIGYHYSPIHFDNYAVDLARQMPLRMHPVRGPSLDGFPENGGRLLCHR